jgi:dinuclear metal center YbgI/SA1388 family protein
MLRTELVSFLDALLLDDCPCQDASNNGLQVEGDEQVSCVAFAVDACLEVFERAAEIGADFLVVHHGISWGTGFQTFTGNTAARFRTLFCNGISLYGVHLPLDAHPQVGNNAVLAQLLELGDQRTFAEYGGIEIGYHGVLPAPMALADLAQMVQERVGDPPIVIGAGAEMVERIGIVSGGGADLVPGSARLGLDCLLTGEITHQHVHTAREYGINVIAAGHYRTEVWGVQAVQDWVADAFPELDCQFLDVPTGF